MLSISKELFVRLIEEDTQISANVTRAVAQRLEGTLHEYGKANVMYDTVTGLPTMSLFADRYGRAVAQKIRHDHASALLTVDLGELTDQAHLLEREAREEMLREVADRLRKSIRVLDTVAFVREMEFAIIMNQIGNEDDSAVLAQRIARALAEPFAVAGRRIELGRNFTFSINPLEDGDVERILEMCRQGKSKVLTVEV